jgi:hypothetical protein
MKRNGMILIAVIAMAVGLSRPASANSGTTLFIVPARYSVLQVMFDVLRRREALLMSYQGEPDGADPVLHAWNGLEWLPVTLDDYREAQFLSVRPARVVLVGDAGVLPVSLATGAAQWGSRVLNVERMDSSSLVNAAGRLLGFTDADWKWFAARYKMQLTDVESERRNQSWFDQPFVETEPSESPWQIFRRKVLGKSSKPARPAPVEVLPAPALNGLDVEPLPEPETIPLESDLSAPEEPAEAGIK